MSKKEDNKLRKTSESMSEGLEKRGFVVLQDECQEIKIVVNASLLEIW
jgi:hypothetical protein